MEDLIHKEILIKTDRQALFRALTTSQGLTTIWPIERASLGETIGAPVVLEGDGFRDEGVVTDFHQGKVFEYSYWSTTHGTPQHERHHVTIRYELVAEDAGVRLDVRQWNLPGGPYRAQMLEVWDQLLEALKESMEALT